MGNAVSGQVLGVGGSSSGYGSREPRYDRPARDSIRYSRPARNPDLLYVLSIRWPVAMDGDSTGRLAVERYRESIVGATGEVSRQLKIDELFLVADYLVQAYTVGLTRLSTGRFPA